MPLLHRGGKVILLPKFDEEKVLRLCESERATILFGVPTTIARLIRSPSFERARLESIRFAIVGGEPMPREQILTLQERGIPVRQGYGLTEFGPNCFSLAEEDSLRKIGSIGKPNAFVEASLVGQDGKEILGEGEGELALRGPMAMAGYWRRPAETASTVRDGWLHTGDIVRRDAEGYYFVVGRKKDMYISGGENVYPAEVESALRACLGVLEAAVVGAPDPTWGETGHAFVVVEAGSALDAGDWQERLLAHCREVLAKYKIPRRLERVESLPKSDTGKILKAGLRERAAATAAGTAARA
jgi:fatty-acyl-CoA synthase